MSELRHLAETIEKHFVTAPASSFLHFVVVSDGLSGEQAAQVPQAGFNSIWAITNHMAFWMDATRTAFLGEDVDLATWDLAEIGKGWPPIGDSSTVAWLAARQRAFDCCQALAAVIPTLDIDTLHLPQQRLYGGTPHQAILSIYGHNCYHTAEILTVRHMLGLWVDHEWA
ncbi:MAG: DinB family protein [Anaerolineales bacterium]|nr:DinB family protein [Anaerolineales bacterium]MCB0018825.1 DinB family protein [Anaerolineales bacterium]